MEDHIKRSDAIEAVSISCRTCLARDIEDCKKCSVPKLRELINAIPSADRPSGEVDAVKEYEHHAHNLNQGYITLGEFDKRIEPLRHLHYDRPQGEWIDMGDFEQCSVCKGTHLKEFQSYYGKVTWVKTPYCHNCGARMFAKDINVPNKKGADDE